ncbi:hypothetical protein JTE90_026106 [Oedothorax gibbosus]|uniref:Uncharacterized protein n=1 Tax=Oedothorax gibbosus TaxID=931172 RepID=A0AAV6TSX2_9ARAC|nr:hypothetical protein JTE90_026106 [Oedothorax gibbosus]
MVRKSMEASNLERYESKISLFGSDGRKYVRRRVDEALHPECIKATTKNPTNVMILAFMSSDGVNSSD